MESFEVPIDEILPNPFRRLGNFAHDEKKVDQLMESYTATDIWTHFVVRRGDDGFELAFGHNRLEAARRCGFKKVPVVIKPFTNSEMLAIMARENKEEWTPTPEVTRETVFVAKQRLDEDFSKFETLDDFKAHSDLYPLLAKCDAAVALTEQAYQSARTKGAGQTLIAAVTGFGRLNEKTGRRRSARVQKALKELREQGRIRRDNPDDHESASREGSAAGLGRPAGRRPSKETAKRIAKKTKTERVRTCTGPRKAVEGHQAAAPAADTVDAALHSAKEEIDSIVQDFRRLAERVRCASTKEFLIALEDDEFETVNQSFEVLDQQVRVMRDAYRERFTFDVSEVIDSGEPKET